MMLGHPLKAAEDCCVALKFHPGNVKIQLRYARCLLLLGDLEAAFQEASDVLTRENIDTVIKNEANEIHKDIQTCEKSSSNSWPSFKAVRGGERCRG